MSVVDWGYLLKNSLFCLSKCYPSEKNPYNNSCNPPEQNNEKKACKKYECYCKKDPNPYKKYSFSVTNVCNVGANATLLLCFWSALDKNNEA